MLKSVQKNFSSTSNFVSQSMSTEQAAGAIEVDTAAENNDDGYAESSASSTLTSIKSEIRKGMEENGRIYAVYGENGK